MSDDLNAPFEPDWISPPGDSIRDAAEERGWTQAELAQRLGYSEKHISQLINGKVPLTQDTATRLAHVIGSTVRFWLAREANYQRHFARLEAQRKHAE
jgi:HTH-type transcriptional regulator/antitoxin HigA